MTGRKKTASGLNRGRAKAGRKAFQEKRTQLPATSNNNWQRHGIKTVLFLFNAKKSIKHKSAG